jgi:hypothetical protein
MYSMVVWTKWVDFFTYSSGADFPYIFTGEKFGENSAENFPHKNVGKIGIFRIKSFKNCFSKKFHGIFCGKSLSAEKNVRKISPWSP